MKIAYLDCFSGISGDMFLGGLLDAGLPFSSLKKAIETLGISGYSLESKQDMKNDLSATRFTVNVEHGEHTHRGLSDIKKIIEQGGLSDNVKKKSIRIFESIAREEGKIHGRSPDEIHFHEVGAVDSIIDIVGTVFGIEYMGIESISVSSLPLGSGFVESGHGRIPIPAPATIALLKDVPVYDSGLKCEMVTPTGAVLVKELADSFGSMPPMVVDRIGYGAGTRDLSDRPNMLRIIIGKEASEKQVETVVLLEANLDDTNPECLGFLMDRLLKEGALDVVFCPVQMKKNRPGTQLQVIGRVHQMEDLMNIIFRECSTLGVRFRYSQRKVLNRSQEEIESPWGKMIIKKATLPDGSSKILPEYEVCKKIAEENNLPLNDIYSWVQARNGI
ncbi:nickel pincer cofactor biosynthesis protein LarC [Thermodesulfobacteriota bacterium]